MSDFPYHIQSLIYWLLGANYFALCISTMLLTLVLCLAAAFGFVCGLDWAFSQKPTDPAEKAQRDAAKKALILTAEEERKANGDDEGDDDFDKLINAIIFWALLFVVSLSIHLATREFTGGFEQCRRVVDGKVEQTSVSASGDRIVKCSSPEHRGLIEFRYSR